MCGNCLSIALTVKYVVGHDATIWQNNTKSLVLTSGTVHYDVIRVILSDLIMLGSRERKFRTAGLKVRMCQVLLICFLLCVAQCFGRIILNHKSGHLNSGIVQ